MIELAHVSRSFGSFKAVDDIGFSIKTGEIVGLLGPNGAGKTTTMRMITGFLAQDEGSITIDGQDIRSDEKASKRKIGYMPESAPLYGDMIVQDYLEYVARMQGVDPVKKTEALCASCGLAEVMHKNISELSRGYRQRVGLAHALMNDPEILILDEPTSGLDYKRMDEIAKLILHCAQEVPVLIITHDLELLFKICNTVLLLGENAYKKIPVNGNEREIREFLTASVF